MIKQNMNQNSLKFKRKEAPLKYFMIQWYFK